MQIFIPNDVGFYFPLYEKLPSDKIEIYPETAPNSQWKKQLLNV